MARRRKSASRAPALLALIALLVAIGAAWHWRAAIRTWLPALRQGDAAVEASAARIDPAREGSRVRISGLLHAGGAARDPQLGVAASAAVLLRHVEMWRWREQCAGASCRYDAGWGAPVDSRRFREPRGHENPPAPFADAEFAAPQLALGVFAVNAALPIAQLPSRELAVDGHDLAPNMAASFSARGGKLYAGGDPAQPQIGMLRVSYRVVPLGVATLQGVQHGDRLTAD